MSTFATFKKRLQEHIALLLTNSRQRLYTVDVDKQMLWGIYLLSFPEAERQEYDCNACHSFIKQFGNVVGIVNGRKVSIWDFNCAAPFQAVVANLDQQIFQSPINNVFLAEFPKVGVNKNHETKEDGTIICWEHMFFEVPKSLVVAKGTSVEAAQGPARDARNVFARSLKEITVGAIDTVLDLIAQNSLYRGSESKFVLNDFRGWKLQYDKLSAEAQELFSWENSYPVTHSVTIRNTAIGTLLVAISEDKDLDEAVAAFERIMAPANYKRPAAIITPRMIEQAEAKLLELGYAASLGRRFATADDITANNVLFVDRDAVVQSRSIGLLAGLKEGLPVNPRQFTSLEEVSMERFIGDILPRAGSLELLMENRHIGNLMSLIAPRDNKAPSMFKWGNGFSWTYKDSMADSMKQKVKTAGGQTEGELRISLAWYNYDDLDLHVIEPGGYEIYYRDRKSVTGGELDVDMNAISGKTREAVENVIWPFQSRIQEGRYRVVINQFCKRENTDVGFEVEIECQGQLLTFGYDKMVVGNVVVAEFNYSKAGGIQIISSLPASTKVNSQKVWGLDTNKFQRVTAALKSPNHWNGSSIGNMHLFFLLSGARNDEPARGFYNEFLNNDLDPHRRVFEALGSKMRVDTSDNQLSGLGFSSTQHGDIVVKVGGTFNRALRIKF